MTSLAQLLMPVDSSISTTIQADQMVSMITGGTTATLPLNPPNGSIFGVRVGGTVTPAHPITIQAGVNILGPGVAATSFTQGMAESVLTFLWDGTNSIYQIIGGQRDTGWITTGSSGTFMALSPNIILITSSPFYPPGVRIIGDMGHLRGGLENNTGGTTGGGTTWATLPPVAWPAAQVAPQTGVIASNGIEIGTSGALAPVSGIPNTNYLLLDGFQYSVV